MIKCSSLNLLPSSFLILIHFRSEIDLILLEANAELQSLKISEISLNVDQDKEEGAVSLDMRDQLFDAISSLKDKLGPMSSCVH